MEIPGTASKVCKVASARKRLSQSVRNDCGLDDRCAWICERLLHYTAFKRIPHRPAIGTDRDVNSRNRWNSFV